MPGTCYICSYNDLFERKPLIEKYKLKVGENTFIYGNSGQSYKFDLNILQIWLNILKRVPNSVLWLGYCNTKSTYNIKQLIYKMDINSDRVIISNRINKQDHLNRIQQIDVALDTIICNGHTTVCDYLWAGVLTITVLSDINRLMFSRISSSLLSSVGLSDLITNNLRDYENMAVLLALDNALFKKYKEILNKSIHNSPLFDVNLWVTNFTKSIYHIWDKSQQTVS